MAHVGQHMAPPVPNNPITSCIMIWSSNFLDKLRARRSYTELLLNIRTCSVSGPAGSQRRRLLGRCPIGRPGPLWPRIRPRRHCNEVCLSFISSFDRAAFAGVPAGEGEGEERNRRGCHSHKVPGSTGSRNGVKGRGKSLYKIVVRIRYIFMER